MLDTHVDFFAVHGNFFRGIDANANLISFHPEYGNGDFVTDHQGLTYSPGKNKHNNPSWVLSVNNERNPFPGGPVQPCLVLGMVLPHAAYGTGDILCNMPLLMSRCQY